MFRKIVLWISALMVSAGAGWLAYEFFHIQQILITVVAAAFIVGVWYCLFSTYPQKSVVEDVTQKSFLYTLSVGIGLAFMIAIVLLLEENPYSPSGRMRDLDEVSIIAYKIIILFLGAWLSFLFGYILTSGGRNLLRT